MIDLHMHSTASDGAFSPAALARMAKAANAELIALTDHDTVLGVQEAAKEASRCGLGFIPGVEISCGADAKTHMLGYGIRQDGKKLADIFNLQRNARLDQITQMISRLNELGFPIELSDVNSASGVVGRARLAGALVRINAVKSTDEAFDKYLERGRPAYVPKNGPTLEQAILAIRDCGGIPVLAHPYIESDPQEIFDMRLSSMVKMGLGGLECYHPLHNPADALRLRRLCERHGLLITGGSDFHGQGTSHGNFPGCGTEAFFDIAEQTNRLITAIRGQGGIVE